MGKELLIIPCSKKKIWDLIPNARDIPAKDAYISNYFKACRKFAERSMDWLILSAKYGLIKPDFQIPENYDVTVKTKAQKEWLVKLVSEQIREEKIYKYGKIYSLCGKRYDEVLEKAFKPFGRSITNLFPADERAIGKRMRWIKLNIDFHSSWERTKV